MPMRRFWVIGCAALAGRGDPSTASKSRPGGTGGGFSDGETRVFLRPALALGRPVQAQDQDIMKSTVTSTETFFGRINRRNE